MQYYLQLRKDNQIFEKVTKFVFDKRDRALDDQGEPRYTDSYFTVDSKGKLKFNLDGIDKTIIAIIGRMLGGVPDVKHTSKEGGYCQEPDFVTFRIGSATEIVHNLATGDSYQKSSRYSAEKPDDKKGEAA